MNKSLVNRQSSLETYGMKESSRHCSSDGLLLQAIGIRRDRDAFTTLMQRYQDSAYALAYRLTGNRDQALDALQDGMLRVWRLASGFDPKGGNARGWIMRVIAHCSLEQLKRENIQIKKRSEALSSCGTTQKEFNEPGQDSEQFELLAALAKLVDALRPQERKILTLYYGGEANQEELSAMLKIPQSTVSFKLRALVEKLKKSFKSSGHLAWLPLVNTELLREAICSGHSAPADWHDGLVKRIEIEAGSPLISKSRFKRPAWIMGLGVLMALSLAVILAIRRPAPELSSAPLITARSPFTDSKTDVQQASKPDLPRFWKFDKPAPDELIVHSGSWKWSASKKVMLAETARILFPVQAPERPFKITIICQPDDNNSIFYFGTSWFDKTGIMDAERWVKPPTKKSEIYNVHVYFSKHYCLTTVNEALVALSSYPTPYPSREVGVILCNARVYSFGVQEIPEDGLPKPLRHPKRLIKKLNQSPNWQHLSFGKPFRP